MSEHFGPEPGILGFCSNQAQRSYQNVTKKAGNAVEKTLEIGGLICLMGRDFPKIVFDVSKRQTENFLYTHWLPVRITNTAYRILNFSPITLGKFPTLLSKDCVMDPNNQISVIDGFIEDSAYRQ